MIILVSHIATCILQNYMIYKLNLGLIKEKVVTIIIIVAKS